MWPLLLRVMRGGQRRQTPTAPSGSAAGWTVASHADFAVKCVQLEQVTLEYATNGSSTLVGRTVGARGCLFDSATEIFDSNGLNIRMRNPCVIFRKVLP